MFTVMLGHLSSGPGIHTVERELNILVTFLLLRRDAMTMATYGRKSLQGFVVPEGESNTIVQGAWQQHQIFPPSTRQKKSIQGMAWVYPSVMPPNPSQTVLPTGGQVFRHEPVWTVLIQTTTLTPSGCPLPPCVRSGMLAHKVSKVVSCVSSIRLEVLRVLEPY